MASRFETVDEEYIEELKDKSENENTENSTKWWKNVLEEYENDRCPRTTIVAVLSIPKFSNFAFYVINK